MIRASETHRIQRLSEQVVNQIAAGEVIERPASVVKELVENAIDGGATVIRVELEEGGARLIRVFDDGRGIHPDDLRLALTSHATSKLTRGDDLQHIRTLGFRGEALASIASVAEVDLVSRTSAAPVGSRVEARAGSVAEGRPEPMPPGTRIAVRHLFSTMPARKRFLRTARAELARASALLQHIALALPEIGFSLYHHGRRVFQFPAGQTHAERVAEVLGEETFDRLLPLEPAAGLRGWVGRPELARRDSRSILTFLNSRHLRDPVLLHAVRHAYVGFQIPGKYPVAVLFLTVDPDDVDVNVHPAKLEVRFRDPGLIRSQVHGAVRSTVEAAGSRPALFGPERSSLSAAAGAPPPDWREMVGGAATTPTTPPTGESAVREAGARPMSPAPLPEHGTRAGAPATGLVDDRQLRVFQVHNAFLVIEEDDGLSVLDQHALHEKILFEELLAAHGRGSVSQPLLLPETVHLEPGRLTAFVEARLRLVEIGFDVEEFGEGAVLVRAVPAGCAELPAARLLGDLLDRYLELVRQGAAGDLDLAEGMLATVACQRAVKAGQPLSPDMQLDLVRGRALAREPRHCPHGRPAELFMTWAELERRFDRK